MIAARQALVYSTIPNALIVPSVASKGAQPSPVFTQSLAVIPCLRAASPKLIDIRLQSPIVFLNLHSELPPFPVVLPEVGA